MKKTIYILILLLTISSVFSQGVYRDSVVYKKTNSPVKDTVCIIDSFFNYSITSKHKLKVQTISLPSSWTFFAFTSEPQILFPKVGDSSLLPIFDYKEAGVCIISDYIRGYGSITLSIEDITKPGSKKNVKFVLITKDSFIQIADDSAYSMLLNIQSSSSTTVKLKNKLKNISTGDVIKWKLQNTKLVIPSTWSLISVKDNNQVYPYTGTNIEKTFNFVSPTATEDNSLEVEFKHDKKVGYGSLIISVNRESDSIATFRNIKFSLLTTGTSSISLMHDESEKLLYYYDNNIFIDKDFKNHTLNIYDINSKLVINTRNINETYLSTETLPKGTYFTVILDKGQVVKKTKFNK